MTPLEIEMILCLRKCIFLPGSFAKRFVKAMFKRAALKPGKELSPASKRYLYELFHQYRKQIGAVDHNRFCVLCERQLEVVK